MKTSLLILRNSIVALLLLISALNLPAQGTAFTYQGRLNDGAAPANGSYDLQFTIYDALTSGSTVAGPTVADDVAVSNGLFTVSLDFGSAPFNGNARWLNIAVRPGASSGSFTNLTPRQPITSAPYAVRAANASSVAAANITGTIPLTQLPAVVVTNGASGVNIAGTFSGNGAGVSNVSLVTLNSGGAINWPGRFLLASSPGVAAGPFSVTAADVNGDGKVDLISANYGNNTLTVLTNNGSGGFVLSSSPGVGAQPESVTAADVNGDGKADLISANFNDNTLTVLTNNGSGGFVLSSSSGVDSAPRSVTAADVNGDGKVDLISANSGGNTLTVLTNNGSGGFVLSSSPGVGNNPFSVTPADLNGDGKVDLISANASGSTLTVLTNNGSGGFALSSSPGVGIAPISVTTADINGDGNADLISANEVPDTLTVLTNNGSGGFVLSSSPGVGNAPVSVTAADVNGDGKVDLISANGGADTLTVLFNMPTFTGSFTGDGSGLTGVLPAPGSGNYIQNQTASDQTAGFRINGNGIFNGGSVGIGTTLPGALLEVRGASAQERITDASSGNTLVLQGGSGSNMKVTGFNYNSFTAVPLYLSVDGANTILNIGGGNVGIGRSPTANRLEVAGDASKDAAGSWLANSDARIKTDVQTVTGALDKLSQVRLVEFHYTDDYRAQHPGLKDRSYLNVVAQEFQNVFPEYVQSSGEKLPGGGDAILQVDTYPLTIYSAAAIQELNEKLSKELKRRDVENAELKQRLERLERLMNRKAK